MQKVKTSHVIPYPNNPRRISKFDFDILKDSILENTQYFEARPLLLSDRTGQLVCIGGNQRLKVARELEMKEVPCYIFHGLTEQKEREILIRDNVSNGTWNWDTIANEWEVEEVAQWGLNLPLDYEEEEKAPSKPKFTKNITLTYSIEEADRIEDELYRISSTLEQAVQILLQK
jgi:ParB-like chromosome segregation protein Spo0J